MKQFQNPNGPSTLGFKDDANRQSSIALTTVSVDPLCEPVDVPSESCYLLHGE